MERLVEGDIVRPLLPSRSWELYVVMEAGDDGNVTLLNYRGEEEDWWHAWELEKVER